MGIFIILPTQLFPQSKTFWNQWDQIILIEDSYYINQTMHPLKLWMHRSSMFEYFDSISHKKKIYINYDSKYSLPSSFTMYHPTDDKMIKKYKNGIFLDSPGFLLKINQLEEMDTSVMFAFYKRMRKLFSILMDGDKPIGKKWSFDSENRKKYSSDFKDFKLPNYDNKYIRKAFPITELSNHDLKMSNMIYPTNRKTAMKLLRDFIKNKLNDFGPSQDAIRKDILIGNHSFISVPMNIGLITPTDVLVEVAKYKINISSLEGFLRQIIWREFIRMRYILHGLAKWDYLKEMNVKLPNSWYNANTGIETLDWSISRVLTYGYVPHIERLMLLLNYATLLQIKYDDIKKWFITLFCDGYDWVMKNVEMGVTSLNPNRDERFMTKAYLTNGTYLKNMGLTISKNDIDQLKELYMRFIKNNKTLCKKDYRLAAQVHKI